MSGHVHGVSIRIIRRNPNVWQAKCGRHAEFLGASYEEVEDEWRKHVYAETGEAPKAWGSSTDNRWQP